MRLRILLPHRVFLDADGVIRIVVPTASGRLGILPRRLDFAAIVAPGILEYEDGRGQTLAAVAEGVVVKAGAEVLAAVHDAAGGSDPGGLRKTVEEVFRARSEDDKAFREAMARFEADFVRRFLETESRG